MRAMYVCTIIDIIHGMVYKIYMVAIIRVTIIIMSINKNRGSRIGLEQGIIELFQGNCGRA